MEHIKFIEDLDIFRFENTRVTIILQYNLSKIHFGSFYFDF